MKVISRFFSSILLTILLISVASAGINNMNVTNLGNFSVPANFTGEKNLPSSVDVVNFVNLNQDKNISQIKTELMISNPSWVFDIYKQTKQDSKLPTDLMSIYYADNKGGHGRIYVINSQDKGCEIYKGTVKYYKLIESYFGNEKTYKNMMNPKPIGNIMKKILPSNEEVIKYLRNSTANTVDELRNNSIRDHPSWVFDPYYVRTEHGHSNVITYYTSNASKGELFGRIIAAPQPEKVFKVTPAPMVINKSLEFGSFDLNNNTKIHTGKVVAYWIYNSYFGNDQTYGKLVAALNEENVTKEDNTTQNGTVPENLEIPTGIANVINNYTAQNMNVTQTNFYNN